MASEKEILEQFSTSGLKSHELSREAKRQHLGSVNVKGAEANKILDELYPTDQTRPSTVVAKDRRINPTGEKTVSPQGYEWRMTIYRKGKQA